MKILLVSTSALAAPPSAYGGLEAIVWGLAETMPKFGHQVTLITTNESSKLGHYDYTVDNVVCGTLDVVGMGPTSWELNGERTMYQNYKNKLAEYDIIFDHSWYGYPYLSMKNDPKLKIVHVHHGNCFVKDTSVFTDRGMYYIQDLKIGDRVLGHDGKYHKIKRTFKRLVDEKVLRIRAFGSPDMTMTKEHPIFAMKTECGSCASQMKCTQLCDRKERELGSFTWYRSSGATHTVSICDKVFEQYNDKWINADKLTVGDYVIQAISEPTESKHYDLPDAMFRVIGWYLAEGYVDISKNGYYVHFTLARKELNEVKQICNDLKSLGYRPNVYKHESSYKISVGNKQLTQFIYDNFGKYSGYKYIPQWIINCEKNQANLLLKSLFKGDGYLQKLYTVYATISPSLALGVRMMLLKQGIMCNITKENARPRVFPSTPNKIRQCQPLYRIYVNYDTNGTNKYNYISNDKLYSRISKIAEEHYKGFVYDIEVEGSSSFTVFASSVHNSSWRDPRTGNYLAPPVTWPRMCGISKPHAAQLSQQFGRPLRYIHNGIPLLPMPEPANEGYLLSLNRMAPYKGIMDCIDIALQTGHKIKLVGDDVHVESQDFVSQVIERCRQSDGQAEYYGAVDNETKWDLLSKCKAMIACPQIATFQEAFGLYAVEAGMFGKPIVALANGGLMDIIRHGENGLLGSTPARLVELIREGKLDDIKPETCRKIVEDEFSLEAMTKNYLTMATAVVQDELTARW